MKNGRSARKQRRKAERELARLHRRGVVELERIERNLVRAQVIIAEASQAATELHVRVAALKRELLAAPGKGPAANRDDDGSAPSAQPVG
jgi:hypothetical protein